MMSGLSGVGYFYLSLYDPQIPSVLLPEASRMDARLEALGVGLVGENYPAIPFANHGVVVDPS